MCGNTLSPVIQKSFVTHFIPLFSTDTTNNKYYAKFELYATSASLCKIVYKQGVIDIGSQK